MSTFIAVFVAMLCIVLMMAIGVVFAKKPIKGSCGGMSSLGMDTACDICGGNPKDCEKEQERTVKQAKKAAPQFHDAMSPGSDS